MQFFELKDIFVSFYANVYLLAGLLTLLAQLVLPRFRTKVSFFIALFATLVNLWILIFGLPFSVKGTAILVPIWEKIPFFEGFNRHVVLNGLVRDYSLSLVLGFLFLLLFAPKFLKERELDLPEFYQMMLFSISGLLYFIAAQDLITLLVALEMSALPLFILVGFRREEKSANEAAIKYFLLSVISTAFLLMGIGFLYAASDGKTNIYDISLHLARMPKSYNYHPTLFAFAGWLFIISALAFKSALVPFHGWTADVYEGAFTYLTGFLASLIKIAAFAVFYRIIHYIPDSYYLDLKPIFFSLAVFSMFFGNLAALAQQNLKRMFAYSSIAHAGYMVSFFLFPEGSAYFHELKKHAGIYLYFYVTGYALTAILIFTVINSLEQTETKERYVTLSDLRGLSKQNPLAAFLLSIGSLSFAGIPPLVGFFGKFYLLRFLLEGTQVTAVVFVAINSLLAVFYYARVVFYCYWDFEVEALYLEEKPWPGFLAKLAGFAVLILIIIMGLFSSPVIKHVFYSLEIIQ